MRISEGFRGALLLIGVLISSCGGGGGSSASPTALKYSSPAPFTVGQAVVPLGPSVSGQVTGYSIQPALPAGLSIDPTTGVISGTPTAAAAEMSYMVTAANVAGSVTAGVSLQVNDAISYASAAYGFTANLTGRIPKPAYTGGPVASWTVTPALPAGLTLSTTDGSIGGTPTSGSAPMSYTITATNSNGRSTASLQISVAAGPLLELGHTDAVVLIRANSSRVLSLDTGGHWVLQDLTSGVIIASGDGGCPPGGCRYNQMGFPNYPPADLAGNVMIDQAATGIEIRTLTDGHVLGTIPAVALSWYQLATDGSYVSGGSTTSLSVWSTAAAALFAHQGDYSYAAAFSAPGQIQVAMGGADLNGIDPRDSNVIEDVSVPDGRSVVSPGFQGRFGSWFEDGTRFLSRDAVGVWTYSSNVVQQDFTMLPQYNYALGGVGDWFWTYDGSVPSSLNIYKVGASATPALSQAPDFAPVFSGTSLVLSTQSSMQPQATIVDLSGNALLVTNYSMPSFAHNITSYAATSGSVWLVGTDKGAILDGTTSMAAQPRYLALGAITGVAGGSSFFSVATGSGQVLYFDVNTNALSGTINEASYAIAASASGSVLASQTPGATKVYSLPSATVINSLPYTQPNTTYPYQSSILEPREPSIVLSSAGTVLGRSPGSGCATEVVAVSGGAPLWCDTTGTAFNPLLSPDGTLVTATIEEQQPPFELISGSVLRNGVPTALPAAPMTWLDNNRLLAMRYVANGRDPAFAGAQIYDSQGNLLSSSPLPEMTQIQGVTSDWVYGPRTNVVVSLTTGKTLWTSVDPPFGAADSNPVLGIGAVAGSQIVFVSGTQVLVQRYQ